MTAVNVEIGDASNVLLVKGDFFEGAQHHLVVLGALAQQFLGDFYHEIQVFSLESSLFVSVICLIV